MHEYGLDARRLTRLPGADPQARAYRLETDTDTWFVKVRPGPSTSSGHRSTGSERVDVGASVAEHLAVLGLPELLVPVRSTAGPAVTQLGGATVVVWPYVEGRDGFAQHQDPQTLRRVGAVLRAVHDLPLPIDLAAIVPVNDRTDRWRRVVSEWYAVGPPTHGAHDEVVEHLTMLLERHRSRLTGLVRATGELSARLPESNDRVLCHGDLHAGNVLVGRDAAPVILDWDSAVLGDRERDLMFPGAAIGGAWADDHDVDAFLAGYGPLPDRELHSAVIAFYRADRVLADVALFTEQVLDLRAENRPRAVQFLASALGPGDAAEAAERTIAALA